MSLSFPSPLLITSLSACGKPYLQFLDGVQQGFIRTAVLDLSCAKNLCDLSGECVVKAERSFSGSGLPPKSLTTVMTCCLQDLKIVNAS